MANKEPSVEKKHYDVIIIGGGWAGLSAAIKLADNGKNICVLEAAKQIGGRARQINYKDYSIDNGTHIMVGAYTSTLHLINKVQSHANSNFKEENILERQALNLNYKSQSTINIPAIKLVAPFNILFGFIFASGLNLKQKLLILSFGIKVKLNLFKNSNDTDLKSFLEKQKQTESIITMIWEPLCLAIMNTPINQTSTEIFLKVVKDAFFSSRVASDLLFFKKDLSSIFPTPAKEFIESKNGTVTLHQSVQSLQNEGNCFQIKTNRSNLSATNIIIATAPVAAIKLLQTLNNTKALNELVTKLSSIKYQPICTVYLHYPQPILFDRTMQGFIGTTTQWMFRKSAPKKNGFVSVIISSQGEHMSWSNSHLIQHVTTELNQHYPQWPQPDDAFVIREKRATFTASVNINRIRPNNRTDINQLWLAGDYTNTQYPATIEGAVRSGLSCAKQLLEAAKTKDK